MERSGVHKLFIKRNIIILVQPYNHLSESVWEIITLSLMSSSPYNFVVFSFICNIPSYVVFYYFRSVPSDGRNNIQHLHNRRTDTCLTMNHTVMEGITYFSVLPEFFCNWKSYLCEFLT